MTIDRDDSQGRPRRREPGRAGRRARARRLRPELANLEERTLLSTVQAIDLGDSYDAGGTPVPLLRATDQVVVGVAPGADAASLSARLTADGGPLAGFTTTTTGDGRVVIATAAAPLAATPADQLAALDAKIAQVQAQAGVAFATEAFQVAGTSDTTGRIFATRDLIVQLAPGEAPQQAFNSPQFASYQPLPGTPDQFVVTTNAAAGAATIALADQLGSDPRFLWASPNFYRNFAPAGPNDPLLSQEANLALANVPAAWSQGYDGTGIVIASIDTGVQQNHPDLTYWTNPGETAGNGLDDDGNGWTDDLHGWNFLKDNTNLGPIGGSSHGTMVAGIEAATGDNSIGVAGVAYHAQLMTMPVIDSTATDAQVASAIYYAAGRTADGLGTWTAADIINNSWVLSGDSPAIDAAFDWAATFGRGGKGTILVAATGNGGNGSIANPASLPSTIAVGASDATDHRASYSQYGAGLDLVAPVVPSSQTTTTGGTYTASGTGTSFAAPMVSGVVALMLQANPDLTGDQVRQILQSTADQIGGVTYTNGFNPQYGHGKVDAGAAIDAIVTAVTMNAHSPITLFEGQAANGVSVADFSFYKPLNPSNLISNYSVMVNPGDGGASLPGTIVDNGDGTYGIAVDGLKYTAGGTYNLTVSLYRSGVLQAQATDSVNAVHQVTASLKPFSPTEGTLFNGVVAHFDTSTAAVPSEFTALITWGDGTASPGLVATDLVNGGFTISGSNRYLHEGTYPFSIALKDLGVPLDLGNSLTGNVTVQDASISAKSTSFSRVEGQAFSGVVATFTDANTFGRLSDYAATIDWGDNSGLDTTTVAIGPNGMLGWNVSGTHTYRLFGNYTVKVSITGGSTSKAEADTTAKITDAAINVTPSPTLNLVEGTDFSGPLATFTDANPQGQAGDFVAAITWGDGGPDEVPQPALVQKQPDGSFAVLPSAPHHYRFGQYAVGVTITASKAGGVSANTSTTAAVSDAPLTGISLGELSPEPLEGRPYTGVVAAFLDSNPYATRPLNAQDNPGWGDGSAKIDWGDGSAPQVGLIQYDAANDRYLVIGTDKVFDVGSDTIKVTITGNGGATASATATATIANAALHVAAKDIGAVTEGTQYNGVVATFTDDNPNSSASNFQATIDWGNGTSVGTVLPDPNGGFDVRATRVFAIGAPTSFKVTITDKGAAQAFVAPTNGTVRVVDAPISAAQGAGTVNALEGYPFAATLATFVDTNPSGQPSQWKARIDWGDGTTSSGSDVTVARALGGAFGVSSSHKFAVGTHAVKVTITSLDDPTNTATVTTTVVVPNAALAIQGTNQSLTQGQSVSGVIAAFNDANPSQVASAYGVSISWGDGSAPTAGRLVTRGAGQFNVEATDPHRYLHPGTFDLKVTVTDGQGGSVTSSAQAVVANSPMFSSLANFAPTALTAFSGTVATFRDANTLAAPGSYSATIDWGDGTKSGGTVVPNGDGTYHVDGAHTYAKSGPENVTVTVSDGEGGTTSAFGAVNVGVRITQVEGRLNPADDHGPSNSDGITNVSAPSFSGKAGSGDTVTLYAVRGDLPFPLVIGSAKADTGGAWAITSVPLTDGIYTMIALATDDAGHPSSLAAVIGATPGGQIVIDTQAPRVTASTLDPRTGRVLLTIQDNLVGLDQAGLANLANYGVAQSGRAGATPITLAGIAVTPGAYSTPQTVSLQAGQKLGSGGYVVSINGAGVTDLAGNPLNGGFFTPTTPARPGTAFVAQLNTDGATSSGPVLPSVTARSLTRRPTPASRFNRRLG